MKLIIVRITGKIDLAPAVVRTFELLKLKKKFSCIVLDDTPESLGMLKRLQDYVAFGKLEEETLKQLLTKRAKSGNKQANLDAKNADAFIREFMDGKTDLKKLKINNVFALHPPRGGFKKSSKLLWPRGILGQNKEINKLVLRMV